MTGLDNTPDTIEIADKEQYGPGLKKLLEIGKRIDFIENVLNKKNVKEKDSSELKVSQPKTTEQIIQSEPEDSLNQDFLYNQHSVKEDISKIIEASREKRFASPQIQPSAFTEIGGFVQEAPRTRKVNALDYAAKIGEGIKSVPENIVDALKTIWEGREKAREGLRYITGQDEFKNTYTIYDKDGNEITNTSNKEIADLYREQGFKVKSKFENISPLSVGFETIARGTAKQGAGAVRLALSSIPAVMGYTAIMPLAAEIGGDIAEKLGYDRKKGEEITNKIAPFAFGPAVGIGSLLSDEGIKKLEESGAFEKLKPEDREIAKELIQNGLFFGTILGIKAGKVKLDKKLETKLNKEIDDAFENLSLGTSTGLQPIIPSERIPQSKTAEKLIESSKYTKGRTPEEKEIIERKLEQLAPTAGEIFFGEKPEKKITTETAEKGIKGLIESEDIKKVRQLANDIIQGKTEFTPEELQLQKNYPQLLEEEINKLGGIKNAEGIRSNKGLLPEERTAAEESKGTGSTNIQQKAPIETTERLHRSEREAAEEAKQILTTLPTAEVIKRAKKELGKDFDSEFNSYLKLPNNKARLENAEDKEFEKGLLLEDFSRRTLAADLLNADIDSDLYGLAEQKLKLAKAEQSEVIGAKSGRAIKLKLPAGEEKIFVMGEGSHKDPMAMAFRYLADDLIKQGMSKEEAEEAAEDYITDAAINNELDIGDYREGKFISSWGKEQPQSKENKPEVTQEITTVPQTEITNKTKTITPTEAMEMLYGEPKAKTESIPKSETEPETRTNIKETIPNKETAKEIEKKLQETKFAEIKEVPIKEIKTDEGRFQNRAESFSEETASSIEKNYNPAAFDPIIVWKDPKDNNIYVLAGHSRLEGMKRRGAKTIPAKFFEGTEKEAINFAIIESNRKATQEDLLADIRAYKKAKSEGYSKQKLLELFKKESRIKALDNYSHLDEDGQFLKALNSESAKSYPYLERNASWVGELRKMYPQLTDGHEQELFDYFYRDKLSHSFIKKEDLFNKVEDRVTDVTFKPNQKLALDKLESVGARARSDTRDIQLKIDLLKARNRELVNLSKGAPLEQRNIFQKEIIANTEEIKKLESNINEIVNSQIDIFEQLDKELKEGGMDEESGSQIITSGDPEEFEKLAEDIESKAKAVGRISTEKLREEINKSGQILYQRYIEYKDNPDNEIEVSLLKAYNSFDHELPLKEEIIDNLTKSRWIRKTQNEEIQRTLASFLKDFVNPERFENHNDFIKRALKERPELITSYIFLKNKLNEAVKKREKDSNFISEYRKSSAIISKKEENLNRFENIANLPAATEKEEQRLYQKNKFSEASNEIFNAAKKIFGTTLNEKEAGYILPDGTLLDFSGKKEGGDPNSRAFDHREIIRLTEYGYETNMDDFINRGAIRFMPEITGFFMTVPPTLEQRNVIKRIVNKYNGYVILEAGEGSDIFYKEYDKGTKADEVLRDIDNYFLFGKSKSEISKIRNSAKYGGSKEELFQLWELERTPLQQLQDRKRHLQYVIESDKSSIKEKLEAEDELEKVNKQLRKLEEKNTQLGLFEGEQGSLFQRNKASIYKKIINDKEIEYKNDLKEFGFDITKDDWEVKRRELIKAVQDYYKNTHPRSVINNDTGKEILIGRESEEKPFTHVGRYEQLVVNKNIPEILKDAIYIGEAPNEKNIKGYEKFEYFLKSLKIDGGDFTVKISVGVDKNGRWHYDNSTLEINRSDLLSIVRLNYLSSQQATSAKGMVSHKFVVKDKNLENILQEIIAAHEGEKKLEQRKVSGIRKVYEKMNEKEKRQFIEEIRKGINSEWLIGQKDLTKEQAKGLTDLLEKAILFDPEKADITTAWEESFHASIVTLARPHLARNLLRENGWDGKGEIWDVANNPTLRKAHENLANKYIEWRKQQEENPSEPKTRLERLFQLLRELWAKIASYLNKIGLKFEAGYFYDLATGKLRKSREKISDIDYQKEAANSQTNFERSLEEFKKGKLTKPAKVTNTPEILVRLGAKQLPITITPDVINKVINKHNITYEQLKDLPVELHDPLMVFESATYPNSFVILTELKSPEGSVIAAIHLNKKEDEAFVNRIASVYGKDREEVFIDWINKGLLKYINKKRSQILISPARLQLPLGLTKTGKSKILTEDDFVNNKLMQKISDIQGELFSKDIKYYMNRIAAIKNIFELRNWRKKHEAEIEELPTFDKEEIINSWNKKHKDFTGQEGNWKTAEAKQKNKYENTKEAYKKYLPEASEIYDEGFRRYTDFSEKIKEKAGNISPDDILKLYREVIKAKLREYEKSKEETGTFVEPKTDITDKKAEEIKKEIEKYLINKNIPAETQEKILQTAEEIINNPKNRIGKHTKIKRLTYFGEKVKIMTLKYGAAGAELAQRMAKGNVIQGQLVDKYFQIVNKIKDIYDDIRSEEYGEQRIKEIEDKIINALEDRANYKEYLETDDEIKLYELYKMIYGDKDMNDGLYAEIKKAGYPVRTDYFPHIIRDGFIIDEIVSDPKDIIKTDVRGLNNFIYADSRYLKPREFDIEDIKRDLLSVTQNYIFSVAKALAYKDAVNYYYTDFKKDIPELLRKQGFSTAIEFMRSNLNPELPSKNLAAKFFRGIRSAEYMNFLTFSLKNAVQNYTQKDFARLYMTNEAVKLTDKIFYKLKTPTGNLLNAIHEASQETPRFLELTAEEANRSKILKINERIKNYEPFHLAEMTNWRYAELGGIIDYVTKQKAYKDLINKGMGEIEAINKVLEDKKMFDMAVRNGMDLAANSQISPTAAYRPSLFDKEIVRFFLMFRRFPITHLEHLSQTLFKSLEGAEGLRAQRILRRGLSEDVKTVEALRAVEYFRKAMDIMIDKIKNKKDYKDYEIGTIEEMRDWLKQQEKILNKTIEKLEPIKNKSEIIYHWSKYYAKMLMISTLFQFLYDIMDRMFKQIINGDDEEKRMQDLLKSGRLTEKQKRALITELAFKSIFDSMPLPAYGLNPANLMITPLIPKVEIFPYGNYSIFNERGIVRSITNYGLNIVPGLGLVDRVTGRVLSNKITDIISPKQERKNQIKMIPPGRGRVNERPGLGR